MAIESHRVWGGNRPAGVVLGRQKSPQFGSQIQELAAQHLANLSFYGDSKGSLHADKLTRWWVVPCLLQDEVQHCNKAA